MRNRWFIINRKSAILGLFLAVVLYFAFTITPTFSSSNDPSNLINSVEKMGGFTEYKIAHGSKVPHSINKEAFMSMGEELQKSFSITFSEVSHPGNHQVMEFIGEKPLSKTSKLQMKWVGTPKGEDSKSYEAFLLIKVTGSDGNKEAFLTDWELIKNRLQEAGITPSLNFTLQKELSQVMNQDKQANYLEKIFKELDGTVRSNYKDDSQMIFEGYSDRLSNGIMSEGQMMNLQMSIKSDQKTNKTIVEIGSPLLILY
ncbi:YwmB family TATA-box binding protein [Halobacillus shinanisalinarum]|uniref:YwmB family TATA-box binding protein n=1 Tax=Halobacillus shinanisalinarum TaxID=2932258 RepID=A0ABY4H0P5_9BACI|nr:YwmB family TATA-box binding protein [Halobacillus shinanisalinarum]UOQ94017.1 YwmB family TATA-box binding protein [Halobacillus shinanisalinarum]